MFDRVLMNMFIMYHFYVHVYDVHVHVHVHVYIVQHVGLLYARDMSTVHKSGGVHPLGFYAMNKITVKTELMTIDICTTERCRHALKWHAGQVGCDIGGF